MILVRVVTRIERSLARKSDPSLVDRNLEHIGNWYSTDPRMVTILSRPSLISLITAYSVVVLATTGRPRDQQHAVGFTCPAGVSVGSYLPRSERLQGQAAQMSVSACLSRMRKTRLRQICSHDRNTEIDIATAIDTLKRPSCGHPALGDVELAMTLMRGDDVFGSLDAASCQ